MACIAIDATFVAARPTGAGRALRNLLAALPDVDSGNRYVALVTEEGASALEGVPGLSIQIVAPEGNFAWELLGAARAADEAGADLLFTVREIVGRRSPPTVVHVFEPPAYRLRADRLTDLRGMKAVAKDALLASLLSRSLRRAAAVTAGSATTAAWLKEHFGTESTVVLPGVEEVFRSAGDARPPDTQPYVLHLASGDSRDRTQLVLAALARLGGDGPRLLVAGLGDAGRARLAREAHDHGLRDRVEPLGWVSDEELRDLYAGALAYVHVSRYESYGGLAALEAMALGTPVIALAAPGVSEALTGAALLVKHADAGALAAGLRQLIADPELRRQLAKAGRDRVEPLRWERAAAELAAVFARVLG